MLSLFETVVSLLASDSYKIAHGEQYPENTKYNFSYLEARGGAFTHTLSFGLQAFLIKLNKMFDVEYFKEEMFEQCRPLLIEHFMGDAKMVDDFLKRWRYIFQHHKGKLPLRIQALPEGTISPINHPLITIENTDPNCAWLVGWIETLIQRQWYPNVVAINSASIKSVLSHYRELTTGSRDGVEFMLHDFGARSATSDESAEIAASAHLLNFLGTDTLCAFRYTNLYYGSAKYAKGFVPGFSVPATEHSTTTSYLRNRRLTEECHRVVQFFDVKLPSEDLQNAYEKIFLMHAAEFKDQPFGIVSIVIDSEGNPEQTARWLCTKYKQEWSKTYPNVRLVLRPDSGDPVLSVLSMFKLIEEIGGCTINSQGFKEFNLNIGVIQGDGVSESIIQAICQALIQEKFSVSRLVFGMGGKLHQSELDRDTQAVAYKLSNTIVEEKEGHLVSYLVNKQTIGKISKAGRLMVFCNHHGDYMTGAIPEPKAGWTHEDLKRSFTSAELASAIDVKTNQLIPEGSIPLLRTVYENGEILIKEDFETVRARADSELQALRRKQAKETGVSNEGSLRVPSKLDRRQLNPALHEFIAKEMITIKVLCDNYLKHVHFEQQKKAYSSELLDKKKEIIEALSQARTLQEARKLLTLDKINTLKLHRTPTTIRILKAIFAILTLPISLPAMLLHSKITTNSWNFFQTRGGILADQLEQEISSQLTP